MSDTTNVQNFKCPNCGAPVPYDGKGEMAVRCNYCGATVPVPPELLPRRPEPANPSFVINVERPMDSAATKGIGCGTVGVLVTIAVVVGVIIIVASVISNVSSSVQSSIPDMPNPANVKATALAAAPTRLPPTPALTPTPRYAIPVLTFGSEGTGAGRFTDARNIGLDGKGNVYVGEYTGGKVQVFDATGKFVSSFFAGNSKTLMLGFAVDRKGTVYVADGQSISRYDGATGKSLGKLTYPGGPGFGELALTPDGGLVAMWYQRREGIFTSTEGAREDLVRFDAQGKVTLVISAPISSQTEDVSLENVPAVDGQGNLYILSQMASSIFKFAPDGKFVNRFGSSGSAPGQFGRASYLAIDSQGQLYVADYESVHIYGPNGRYVRFFTLDKSAEVLLFDDQDNLFTLNRTRVVKYTLGL